MRWIVCTTWSSSACSTASNVRFPKKNVYGRDERMRLKRLESTVLKRRVMSSTDIHVYTAIRSYQEHHYSSSSARLQAKPSMTYFVDYEQHTSNDIVVSSQGTWIARGQRLNHMLIFWNGRCVLRVRSCANLIVPDHFFRYPAAFYATRRTQIVRRKIDIFFVIEGK